MRILTAAASPIQRAVLAAAFDDVADIEVVASAGSVADLLALSRRLRPDVVVSGAAFADGAFLQHIFRILRGGSRVLIVCEADASEDAAMLLMAGASGCLYLDDCGLAEMVVAVRQVAAGDAALHPAAAATVLRMWRAERMSKVQPTEDGDPATRPTLTARESEVLNALARGLPTKGIGRELEVSPKTVESHIARVLTKLGARNRSQAVALADEMGLLSAEQER